MKQVKKVKKKKAMHSHLKEADGTEDEAAGKKKTMPNSQNLQMKMGRQATLAQKHRAMEAVLNSTRAEEWRPLWSLSEF